MSKDEDKELKDIVEESIDELEDEDLDEFDDYEDPDEDDDEYDDEDDDDSDDDDDDDDDEDDEEAPKGKGVSPVILGGVGLAFLGAVGFVGATQFGLLPGSGQDEVIAPMPDPIADDMMMEDPVMDAPVVEATNDVDIMDDMAQADTREKLIQDPVQSEEDILSLGEPMPSALDQEAQQSNNMSVAPFDEQEFADELTEEILGSSELKEMIKKAQVNNQSLSADEIEQLVERQVSSIMSKMKMPEAQKVNLENYVSTIFLKQELQKVRAEIAQANAEQRLSKSEVKQLLKGRDRLKGFVVINKSIDGEMTVVKTPMKRINVYYKGERFKANGKWHTVKSIEDYGHIVLVGDKYFIDEVEEKLVVKQKPKAKPKAKVVKKETPKPEVKKKAVNPEMIESRQYRAEAINGKKIAVGYSKNGEYGSGYLIKKKDGEWDTVGKGDIIEGLGKVLGVDIDQNLIVGEWVILNADK